MSETIELDKEPMSKLVSINSALKILIDISSCPNIMELLSFIQFLDMMPTLLNGFINFHKQNWQQEWEQQQLDDKNMNPHSPRLPDMVKQESRENINGNKVSLMPLWYEKVNCIDMNEEEQEWFERSQMLLKICANSLKLIYLLFIYRKQCGIKRYSPQIAKLLFDILSVIGTRIYLFDPSFDSNSNILNNGYFVNIVEKYKHYASLSSKEDASIINKHQGSEDIFIDNTDAFKLLCESLAGVFAFTLCCDSRNVYEQAMNVKKDEKEEKELKQNNMNRLKLYDEHCWQFEKYLDYLLYKPHLFVFGLQILHQCLIHVKGLKAVKLENFWKIHICKPSVLKKLGKLTRFCLSNDENVCKLLPCVMIQLSGFGNNVAQTMLDPMVELLFSRFVQVTLLSFLFWFTFLFHVLIVFGCVCLLCSCSFVFVLFFCYFFCFFFPCSLFFFCCLV